MPNPNPKHGFDKNPENINKNGRPPKEWTWSGVLRKAMEESVGKKQMKELVSEALMEKARMGDVAAIKEIGDRIDGRAKQNVEVGGTGEDGEIIVKIKDYGTRDNSST